MIKLSPYMKARKFRKRSLLALIFLINSVFILILVHKNKTSREDKADIGSFRWFSSKKYSIEAFELLQEINFSEMISRKKIKLIDVKNCGSDVDSILHRVNIEVRILLFID